MVGFCATSGQVNDRAASEWVSTYGTGGEPKSKSSGCPHNVWRCIGQSSLHQAGTHLDTGLKLIVSDCIDALCSGNELITCCYSSCDFDS